MTLSPSSPVVSQAASECVLPEAAELVRAEANGNARAFEEIAYVYQRRVVNLVYEMTRQRQDAEDRTLQTFVKSYQLIERGDGARPIINCLLSIARRTALKHFRSARIWEYVPAVMVCCELT